ncbi:MAG TPA: AarF/UbiB family protein, partial [Chloroflexota bacterium]|nr:AarF/UbiB family protein [Chloroflexota bacterium]
MALWRRNPHLRRYRQIADVFVRHGLGSLVDILGIDRFVPWRGRLTGSFGRNEALTRPVRLRLAFSELGTTFIKLGQILSTRADLLPADYQFELAKLQDQAPPIPGDIIRALIVNELGRPLEAKFASFDLTPLAAASIGQAHAATLLDGTEVVVKVRRPDVDAQVEEDLEIMLSLAAVASRRWELADQYDVVGLTQEFAETLRAELDYVREGRNAERFAASFKGHPDVHIPRIFWDTSTARILTLERIRGIKVNDDAAVDACGIGRRALAERAVRILFKMTFEDGFFHADPHPGNFLIEPAGSIGLMDFGMVGSLDDRTQGHLVEIFLAIASQNSERAVDALLDLGVVRRRVNRYLLRRDLDHLLARYYGRSLGEIDLGIAVTDSLDLIRRHHLQLPANLALLAKTMMMNEGLGLLLDPTFAATDVIGPYARQLIVRQYAPARLARRFALAAADATQLGVELPEHLRRIM